MKRKPLPKALALVRQPEYRIEEVITDPFVVISILEKSLESLKSPMAKSQVTTDCLNLRKEISLLEFGIVLNDFELKPAVDYQILNVSDPLTVLDHLEKSIGCLSMPVARLQGWLTCATIRGHIFYYEYKKEYKICCRAVIRN